MPRKNNYTKRKKKGKKYNKRPLKKSPKSKREKYKKKNSNKRYIEYIGLNGKEKSWYLFIKKH